MKNWMWSIMGMVMLAFWGLGCGGRMPSEIGMNLGGFAPCPDKPNCVSSFASDAEHQIVPLEIEGSQEQAWQALRAEIQATSNAEIVTSTETYLHVIYTSQIMRYRDDVEFVLRADENEIGVRSASRVGYGDMGVNRSRIEAIRQALLDQGLVSGLEAD